MIWLALAFGATPEELAAAMPAAQEQLTTCMEDFCEKSEAAKAAFVVALGTYVTTGEADGEMASVVEALDPALFKDLPEVVQSASGTPPSWVEPLKVWWMREGEIAGVPVQFERRPLPPVEPHREGLTLTVLDAEGRPVPEARVRIGDSPLDFRVDPETATLTAGGVREGKTARYFEKGEAVHLTVFAPGFEQSTVVFVLARSARKNQPRVKLARLWPESDGTPEGMATVRAWDSWLEAERAVLSESTPATQQKAERSRVRAAISAAEWAEQGHSEARGLCLSTGLPDRCP